MKLTTSLLALAVTLPLHASEIVFTDLSAFLAKTEANTVATFEDVTAGATAPVTSAGATFSAVGGTVVNSLVNLPHTFWFGSAGSSPNFFGTVINYNVNLPSNQNAFGVLMSCFGCDQPNDSRFSWTLYTGPSATGLVVDTGSQVIDLSSSSDGNPRFLGVVSSAPFRSIAITKVAASSGFGGGAYVIDDFRFANTAVFAGSIAHIATGNGWQTTFVLVNNGTTPAQAHLKFFDDNGSPLPLPISPSAPGGIATSSATVDQTLPPGGTLTVESAGPLSDTAPTVGSAQLFTGGNVGGFVIFRYNPNNQEAVVPLESRLAAAFVLAFDNTGGTATGVAINSVSAQPINVPVVIRDASGAQIATDIITLAANGHLAFTLATDKYPGTANLRGTIEFDTLPIPQFGVLGIRIPLAHTFTTLPVLVK